jgi:hypothetical protein
MQFINLYNQNYLKNVKFNPKYLLISILKQLLYILVTDNLFKFINVITRIVNKLYKRTLTTKGIN